MDEDDQNISFCAPKELAIAAKLDAVRRGLKLREWWQKAGRKYLSDKAPDTPKTT